MPYPAKPKFVVFYNGGRFNIPHGWYWHTLPPHGYNGYFDSRELAQIDAVTATKGSK